MKYFTQLKDVTVGTYKQPRQKRTMSDTIYSFDIETTSLFNYGDRWDVFDYSKPKEFYLDMDKIAIPYIWQFGVEDTVYYGRDFMDFEKVLLKISDPHITKIIWVHNLSYEFGFLPNILRKYTIENMCARSVRKPISFYVKELNIMFRCSYMLTNLSLEKASEEYTNIKKLHSLDYDAKVRTPKSKLTRQELKYCEYDIKCLYEIIKHFKNKYTHVGKIPLTATSEVRKALLKHVDYYYLKKQWDLVPTPNMYLRFMACFQGGYTHANMLNVGRIIEHVKSYDISSSYPTVMCLEKFPCSKFIYIDLDDYNELKKDSDKYAFMFHVKLKGVKSKYYNNYIAYSRCESCKTDTMVYDNGRIAKCEEITLWVTDVDLEIIKKNYSIKSIEYLDIYYAKKDYLDIRVILFILELYGNKTKLKGIADMEDIYKLSKSYINSLYGMSVTNPLKNSADYNGDWFKKDLTMDFVTEVLNNSKKSYSTLFYYPVGVWVTAYARRNLYMQIISSHEFDKHVIYCDTDSIKYYGNFDYIFESYNKQIRKKYKKVCERFSQLNIDMFEPKDKHGKKHPLGIFDYEGEYQKFITLGAKKYCYTDADGLHITVSGVNKKKGAQALKSIEDFKKGFTWGYKNGGSLTHYYCDDMTHAEITDCDGNKYYSSLDYGIILQPTTYTLGITPEYLALYEYIQEKELRR